MLRTISHQDIPFRDSHCSKTPSTEKLRQEETRRQLHRDPGAQARGGNQLPPSQLRCCLPVGRVTAGVLSFLLCKNKSNAIFPCSDGEAYL